MHSDLHHIYVWSRSVGIYTANIKIIFNSIWQKMSYILSSCMLSPTYKVVQVLLVTCDLSLVTCHLTLGLNGCVLVCALIIVPFFVRVFRAVVVPGLIE